MPLYEPTARVRRLPDLLLFAGFAAWYFGARALAGSAARGLAGRFEIAAGRELLEACFRLFLLVIGFVVLRGIARQAVPLRELVALPRRPTAGREWLSGVALGWGIVVVWVAPLILSGRLHARFVFTGAAAGSAVLTLGALAVATLANDMAFRGYPFRCLIRAVGQTGAVVVMVAAAGFTTWRNPYAPGSGVVAAMLLTLLLALTWLRTHAVWLAWGLHFALAACVGVLFGLPVGKAGEMGSVVRGSAGGPDWLTGGDWGPGAAAFSALVLVGAIPVLYRMTREFAWAYTHREIVAGGYEVTVGAPAAHVAMEEEGKKAAGLVQILATTPQSFSAGSPPPPVPDRLH